MTDNLGRRKGRSGNSLTAVGDASRPLAENGALGDSVGQQSLVGYAYYVARDLRYEATTALTIPSARSTQPPRAPITTSSPVKSTIPNQTWTTSVQGTTAACSGAS